MRSLTRAVNVLIALLVAVGSWFFVLPERLGGFSTYTVVSGPSMEPRYHTGDLILARPSSRYRIGQVVVYSIPDKKFSSYRVVHRVIDRTADNQYVTKGDNQDHEDPWLIGHDDIDGGRVLSIPKAGYLLAYMRNPLYLGVLFGIAVTFVAWPRSSTGEAEAEAMAAAEAEAYKSIEIDESIEVDEHGKVDAHSKSSGASPGAAAPEVPSITQGGRAGPVTLPVPNFDWALAVPLLGTSRPISGSERGTGSAHAELDEVVREWSRESATASTPTAVAR